MPASNRAHPFRSGITTTTANASVDVLSFTEFIHRRLVVNKLNYHFDCYNLSIFFAALTISIIAIDEKLWTVVMQCFFFPLLKVCSTFRKERKKVGKKISSPHKLNLTAKVGKRLEYFFLLGSLMAPTTKPHLWCG